MIFLLILLNVCSCSEKSHDNSRAASNTLVSRALIKDKIMENKEAILSKKLFDIFNVEEIFSDNFGYILSKNFNLEEAKVFLELYVVEFINKGKINILKPIIVNLDDNYSSANNKNSFDRYEYFFNSENFSIKEIIENNYIEKFFLDSGIKVKNFIFSIPLDFSEEFNPIVISIDKKRKNDIKFYLNNGWNINEEFEIYYYDGERDGEKIFSFDKYTITSYWGYRHKETLVEEDIKFLMNLGAYGYKNLIIDSSNSFDLYKLRSDFGEILEDDKAIISNLAYNLKITAETIYKVRKLYNDEKLLKSSSKDNREDRHFIVIQQINNLIVQTINKMKQEQQDITRISLVDRIIEDLFASQPLNDDIKAEKYVVRAILFRELSKRDI